MICTEWNGTQKIKSWLARLTRSVVLGAIVIPLSESGWEHLKFSDIPSNQLKFSKESLSVAVDKSASPLIYPLPETLRVTEVQVRGAVLGQLKLKADQTQGEKGADDYTLRIGLVIPGDQSLNWAQRMVAPSWVKKLHGLAPKGSGISHIYFLNLGQQTDQRGRERTHPLSDLIKEKVEWVIESPGQFDLSAKFEEPKQVSAIWLSIDGDDTGSEYTTKIASLKLLSKVSSGKKPESQTRSQEATKKSKPE